MPVVSALAVVVAAVAVVAAAAVAVAAAVVVVVAELGNCFLIFDPRLQIQF